MIIDGIVRVVDPLRSDHSPTGALETGSSVVAIRKGNDLLHKTKGEQALIGCWMHDKFDRQERSRSRRGPIRLAALARQ